MKISEKLNFLMLFKVISAADIEGLVGNRMRNALRYGFITLLLVFSSGLNALGLGSATVRSYLNQPLDVQIQLVGQTAEELESITAGLASAEDFELLGLSPGGISIPLSFEIEGEGDNAIVRVRSELPVKDPVVQILLEVNWSSGRMLREYTLFLDPPTIESPAPQPVVTTPQPQPVSEPARSEPEPVSRPDPVVQQPAQLDSSEYEVQSGDTLWSIAEDWGRGSGYDVNQIMLAIQRLNPNAFSNNNINSMMRGAILRMPENGEIGAVSARNARTEVLRQWDEFTIGRNATADTTPTLADATDIQQPVGDTSTQEPDARLELVPTADELGSDEQEQMREQLSRTEEELLNAQQENQYLNERIQELESQLASTASDSESGIQVDDAELARLEEELRKAREEAELITGLDSAGLDTAALTGEEADDASEFGDAGLDEIVNDLAANDGPTNDELADDQTTSSLVDDQADVGSDDSSETDSTTAADSQPATPAGRQNEQSWYMKYLWWLVGAGGLLLVLILWLMMRGRGEEAEVVSNLGERRSFADSLVAATESETDTDDVAGTEATEDVVTAALDTDEDTGGEDTARSLADEAEGILELLETEEREFQARQQGEADELIDMVEDAEEEFTEEAEDLTEVLDADDSDDDMDQDADAEIETIEYDTSDLADSEEIAEEGSEEDTQENPQEDVEEESEEAEEGVAEVSTDDAPEEESESTEQVADEAEESTDSDEVSSDEANEPVQDPFDAVQDTEDLDDDDDEPVNLEVKLDLARAYMAMDDKDAAITILNEVIADGSEEQVAEAQSMLDQL